MFSKYYDDVEPIVLKDPLANFFGAVKDDGNLVYTFTDVIKLSGHACPTVACAYMLTKKALKELYGDDVPVRGEINVTVFGERDAGVNGPASAVVSFITGAASETGFGGLGGDFVRKNMLKYNGKNEESGSFIFTREHSPKMVKITYHPENIPATGDLSMLLNQNLSGNATQEHKERFHDRWQTRVRSVLLDEVDDLFTIEVLK